MTAWPMEYGRNDHVPVSGKRVWQLLLAFSRETFFRYPGLPCKKSVYPETVMLESEYGIILAERNFLAIPTDVTDT